MTGIRSLKANVTRAEALRHFTGGTFRLSDWFRGPVRSIAELYIPFRLFHVKVVNSGREDSNIFGLDAAQGVMDLYQFPGQPAPEDLLFLQTRNVIPATLASDVAQERLLAKVRRLVFTRGFFRMRDVRFEAVEIPGEICIPYWVAFRGRDGQVRVSVLDAVRRRPEGAKVRQLVENWLRSQ
ncbi:MAG: hypothetical protein HY010_17720 [Acidobacteria bacterium]|nr:hypothetical protein [Acidobacteriota bacterium]